MNPSSRFRKVCLTLVCVGLTTTIGVVAQQNGAQQRDSQPRGTQQRDTQQRNSRTQSDQDHVNSQQSQNLTAEQFAKKAAVSGLKEVHLAEMALQKAQNPKVKEFAKELIDDHQKANQSLMQIAQSKSIMLPPTNLFATIDKNTLGNRQYVRERETGTQPSSQNRPATQPGQNQNQNQNTTPSQNQKTTPGQTPGQTTGQGTRSGQGEVADSVQQWDIKPDSIQAAHNLQMASGAQFDQQYIAAMVKDHMEAVQLFEKASMSLDDNELKRFAQRTLPVLKDHHQKALKLSSEVGADKLQNQNQIPGQGQDSQRQGSDSNTRTPGQQNQPGQPNQPRP